MGKVLKCVLLSTLCFNSNENLKSESLILCEHIRDTFILVKNFSASVYNPQCHLLPKHQSIKNTSFCKAQSKYTSKVTKGGTFNTESDLKMYLFSESRQLNQFFSNSLK